jgi:8-oxo-dGTP pyrophosphatase MutT (NUDIX family)
MMKKFYVGVKGIIHDEERGILLLRDPRIVDVPGGRIDDDENFEQTLRREISEELPGAEVTSVGELLGVYRVPKDIKEDISLVLLFFKVNAVVPEPVALSEEHTDYIWVKSVEDIPETGLNDEIKRIVKEILKKHTLIK